MENLILNLNNEITETELLSYLSFNIFYILGIVFNLFIFIFLKRKLNIKRLSDFITTIVFSVSSLILGGIYIKSRVFFPEFDFNLFNGFLIFSQKTLLIQFIVNIFFIMFIVINYKVVRKARFKTPLINSILLFIALLSSFLIQIQNYFISYLLISIIAYSIYKYGSNMRIRKDDIYDTDFISKSICVDILFLCFYFLSLILNNQVQSDIILVCLSCSFFAKIGIFPIFNYTQGRHYKTNFPCAILLFCFLPLIGFIAYTKALLIFGCTNEIHTLSLLVFLSSVLLTSAIRVFKTKNIINFFANISLCYSAFLLSALLFGISQNTCLKLMFLNSFTLICLYSLCIILKINLKSNKVSFSTFKGIFLNNRFFAFLTAFFLLIITNVIPCGILILNLDILKEIYVFDNTAIYFISIAVIANVLILINSVNLIQQCYSINKKRKIDSFHKKTALNYAVCYFVFIILIVSTFLQIFNRSIFNIS